VKEGLKKIGGFLLLIALFVLVSFAKNEQDKKIVNAVNVNINATEGDPFMDKKDILNLVYTRLDTLIGKPIGNLQLNEVENLISRETSVKSAEVYVKHNGDVHLNVKLKKVIARFKPDSTSGFYIDETGKVMPWVSKYSPRVLTVSGYLNMYNRYLVDSAVYLDLSTHQKLVNDVYDFAKYVNKDPFWKSLIGQVYINNEGDAILIPLLGNQEFLFGELTNYEEKLNKIKRYYKDIAPKMGWNKYKKVNVKFNKQIVCK
jgi:cell division protein FtsQ